MLNSIHLARWLRQFSEQQIDFFLLASSPHRRIHPEVKKLLEGGTEALFNTPRPTWLFGAPVWLLDQVLGNRVRAKLVRFFCRRLKPDFVHALELQNAGYILLRSVQTRKEWKGESKFIVTNYGSDIFWFQRDRGHRQRLESLLSIADRYGCECRRDVDLAIQLGFGGTVLPVIPNAGGFSEDEISELNRTPLQKNSIAIKGYQGWVGRAVSALDAVELIADKLGGFQIELYSCNRSTIRQARRLRHRTGLQVMWSSKGALRHDQMMSLFGRSKVYVGISESDGISTSLLEAMACGAIPVQTSTACCDEWFADTGVRVDTITPEAVADAILAALELAKDPLNAERNRQTITEKASQEKVREAALQYYR